MPAWVPSCCALGLFVYQTLDAIDGKQARRTQSSNALGELFDHGCDSLSTVLVSLATAATLGVGHIPYMMMFQCFTASALFYIAHWQTYVTGTYLYITSCNNNYIFPCFSGQMKFGKFDVTEAQLITMLLMLVSGSFGTGFWGWKLLGFLPLRWIPLMFATVTAFLTLPSTFNNILFGEINFRPKRELFITAEIVTP